MKIETIKKLDNSLYQDNRYKVTLSYDATSGFSLFDRDNLLLYKSPSINEKTKVEENIFHNKIFINNVDYSLELDKLYIVSTSGVVTTYYITLYNEEIYLLKTFIVPPFIKRIMSSKRLSELISKNMGLYDIKSISLDKYSISCDKVSCFLVNKDINGISISKVYGTYLDNNKYSVDISNYEIYDYTKEEVESIINRKILSLKKN